MGVEPDGPAAKSGLMVGDILVGFNGQPVPDHDTLVALLSGDMAGKPAQAQVLRGGQLQVIDVVVGEKA
jgi:S1-C subfamily serine protease